MKVWTIARNTFSSIVRDRIIIVMLCGFVCIVLLMSTPLWVARLVTTSENKDAMQATVLTMVSAAIGFVSSCGSLLAVWAAADSVASEMKSGTILAVMARPVRRWEFLIGKFLGVMLMMLVYTVGMVGLSYLLAWLGAERFQVSPWILIVYPMVRYALYAAIAVLFVMFMHPVLAVGATIFLSILSSIVTAAVKSPAPFFGQAFVKFCKVVYYGLPSFGIISEDKFLALTKSSLTGTSAVEHLTALGYGLDYALVFFLLAVWSFHSRNLKRD
jgi:ABC-type transport system involved in multi-copper enzyme maturation permease subunit